MRRVRFAPSPTGSLHIGNALVAAANRAFGDWLLLRIDDTDASRSVGGGEGEILRDLEWLEIAWDEGPVRQRERQPRYRAAAERLGGDRCGADRRSDEQLHRELTDALGAKPPEYVHIGLVLGPVGGKLSKRDVMSSVADLREAGIPAEAVRTHLDVALRGAREALRRVNASLAAPGRRRQGSQASGAQDSIQTYGQAPRAQGAAADGVSPTRSPASPGDGEGRPVP